MKTSENLGFWNTQNQTEGDEFGDIFDTNLAYLIEPLSCHIGLECGEVYAILRKPQKEGKTPLYYAEVSLFACEQNFYLDFFVGDDGMIHIGKITPIDTEVHL